MNLLNGKRIISLLIRLLVFAGLVFVSAQIWLFSFESSILSAERSEQWMALINRWARRLHLGVELNHNNVRKLAHFTEFAVLGLLAQLFFMVMGKFNVHTALHGLFFGLAFAVADETIQLYTDGRGASVWDVLIDFGGVLAGSVVIWGVALVIWFFVHSYRRRRRSRLQPAGSGDT